MPRDSLERRRFLSIGSGALLSGLIYGVPVKAPSAKSNSEIEQNEDLLNNGESIANPGEEQVNPTESNYIDLGEKGLQPGDEVNDYLEEFWNEGEDVRIPEGTYQFTYDNDLGGEFSDDARLAGAPNSRVVFECVDGEYREDILARDGANVVVANIRFSGTLDGESRIRLDADEDSSIEMNDMHFPDGSEPGTRARPFYVPRRHAGEISIANCSLEGFDNNGIYASSPGIDGEADGSVSIENCRAANSGIGMFRIGSTGSVVRNCVVKVDGKIPDNKGDDDRPGNGRGIRIRGDGDDMLIENCYLYYLYDDGLRSGSAIEISKHAPGANGIIRNVHIHNNTRVPPISGDVSQFEFSNITLSGRGNLDIPQSIATEVSTVQSPASIRNPIESYW